MSTMESSGSKYLDMDSINARYPDLEGQLLLNRVIEDFAIHQEENVPLFTTDPSTGQPQPLCAPHVDNHRKQQLVVDSYKQSVLQHGVVWGVRGSPWAMYSAGNRPPYHMLTWGTMVRGIYDALQQDPTNSNPRLKELRTGGLRKCMLFHWQTPSDVRSFLRDFHNQFGGGSTNHFISWLKCCLDCEARWKASALAQEGGAGGYSSRRWKYIQDNFSERGFPNNDTYTCCVIIMNKFANNAVPGVDIALLESVMDAHCAFTHPRFCGLFVLFVSGSLHPTIYVCSPRTGIILYCILYKSQAKSQSNSSTMPL